MPELKKNQLYLSLRQKILSGELPDRHRLPPEEIFCRSLNVGRVTLRSALEQLAKDRLVVRIPRRGTFVCNPGAPENTVLVVHPMNDSVWGPAFSILPGIEAVAAAHGIKTAHAFTEIFWNDTAMRLLPRLKARNFRGVLFIGSNRRNGDPDLEMLRSLDIPVVMVHGLECDCQLEMPLLYTEYARVVRSALEYLRRNGHRRIAFLNWLPEDFRELSEDEVRNMLRECDLDSEGRIFFHTPDMKVEKLIPDIMRSGATAVLAYSDFLAAQLLLQLMKNCIDVPEDISLMGISGFEIGAMLDPPLTTVDLEYENIGIHAMKLLLDADSWFKKSEKVPVFATSFHIVERNSVLCMK